LSKFIKISVEEPSTLTGISVSFRTYPYGALISTNLYSPNLSGEGKCTEPSSSVLNTSVVYFFG